MTIGIDLDDTLIETTKTGNKYLKKFITDKSISDYHDLSKDEYLKFYSLYLYDIQKNAPLKKDALNEINKINKAREKHYKHYTNENWQDLKNYDYSFNVDKLGVEKTAQLIKEIILNINK